MNYKAYTGILKTRETGKKVKIYVPSFCICLKSENYMVAFSISTKFYENKKVECTF